jgi:hypothetical protein
MLGLHRAHRKKVHRSHFIRIDHWLAMATESRTIGTFRRLVEVYGAQVRYDHGASGRASPKLAITLVDKGEKKTFSSPSDQFILFCIEMARKELGTVLTRADMRSLNLQLETAITNDPGARPTTPCCGYGESHFEMDDE